MTEDDIELQGFGKSAVCAELNCKLFVCTQSDSGVMQQVQSMKQRHSFDEECKLAAVYRLPSYQHADIRATL